MKRIAVATALWVLSTVILVSAVPAQAEVEGIPCIAEPTDMFISYGQLITCQVTPIGDSDIYRFAGVAGETIGIRVNGGTGVGFQPDSCVRLFRPDGTPTAAAQCGDVSAGIFFVLDRTGTHTIVVSENGNDNALSYALALERIAPPSPTAQQIKPGDNVTREINPAGDVDPFFFNGTAGDHIILQVTGGQGVGFQPDPCIVLHRPNGTVVSEICGDVSATIDTVLDVTGMFTVGVVENGFDNTLAYTLSYQCITGACLHPVGPVCDFQMSKTIYVAGDTVTATAIRLSNLGTQPEPVEWKLWITIPPNPPLSLINVGADGTFVLPTGMNSNLGPAPLFPAAGMPLGLYEIGCRFLDPTTGMILYEDLNQFRIQ